LKNISLQISFLVIISILVLTCANKDKQEGAMKASPEEATEYQGKKLSSANDFRENSINGPQYIEKEKYRLQITGLVDSPKTYTYDEVIKRQNYQKVIPLDCVEGWSVNILWEGVLVRDLIKEAGVNPKAKIVIFHAHDGYSTSFPLNYVIENDILLAYKMNGIPLPPERGFPFELVAEGKWGYKWIKWITKIELSDDESYRGFWESRGYSNDGDLSKDFFEER
jgi:DMSO/TMAO reductase YedYZ molybdopterin-dependent catalytic subunit